jgi:hypothetical protein
VSERCPNAIICLDPFHIVKAATARLTRSAASVWNEARKAGDKQLAKELAKYGSCGELTAVDNVDIAIKSNKLSATRALSAEQIPGFAGKTT